MTQTVTPTCDQCGATPAAKVVFQGVTGQLIMHTTHTIKGTYCRECGLAAKDRMNQKTLKGGWFSVGALIGMPILLSSNAIRAGKLKKLDAPVRPIN